MPQINQKTAITLAAVFGIATAALVYLYARSLTPAAGTQAAANPNVSVVVAKETIAPRTTIRSDMLAIRSYPRDEQPASSLRDFTSVEGKVAMQQIPAGSPVLSTAVGEKGPQLGLSYDLKPFQRAVTVPIDPVSGVAGYLKPGDRVDVLATYTGQENNIARVVLQDIALLAIGNEPAATSNVKDKPNTPVDAVTATLAVNADQMQVLALTAAKAKIHLALRSPDDHAYVPPAPVTTNQVFGAQLRPAAPAPAPAPAPQPVYMQTPAAAPAPAPRQPAREPSKPVEKTITVTRGTDTQSVSVK